MAYQRSTTMRGAGYAGVGDDATADLLAAHRALGDVDTGNLALYGAVGVAAYLMFFKKSRRK